MNSMSDIVSAKDLTAEDKITPRIIQYQGKRICVRLEEIYWEVFEQEALARQCKFNELVHNFYNDPRGESNKTAFLRRKAVTLLSRQITAANERLYLRNSELKSVLRATVQPAIVFSEFQNVSRYNRAFRGWLLEKTTESKYPVEIEKMRISFRRSYNCLLENMQNGRGTAMKEQLSVLLPGYVLTAQMNIVEIHKHLDNEQLFLGILCEY